MLVLTDVTETARLAEAVDAERHRLEMTVLSVKESDTFWSLVADYRTFLDAELPALARQFETSIPSGEVYRRIHTFKGLLAQFSFYESPRRLHEVETALAGCEAWSEAAAVQALGSGPLAQALEADLAVLRDGPETDAGAQPADPVLPYRPRSLGGRKRPHLRSTTCLQSLDQEPA